MLKLHQVIISVLASQAIMALIVNRLLTIVRRVHVKTLVCALEPIIHLGLNVNVFRLIQEPIVPCLLILVQHRHVARMVFARVRLRARIRARVYQVIQARVVSLFSILVNRVLV